MKYKIGDVLYTTTGPDFAFEVINIVSPTFDRKTPKRDMYILQFIHRNDVYSGSWNVQCHEFDKIKEIYHLSKLDKILK